MQVAQRSVPATTLPCEHLPTDGTYHAATTCKRSNIDKRINRKRSSPTSRNGLRTPAG